MKVLMINGSPRPNGNTALALRELERVFSEDGIESETLRIGSEGIRGCIACNSCATTGRCVFEDAVNVAAEKFREADGIVVASPVYYASPNGTVESFLDRLFYSTHFDKTMKVGAAVAVARRAGTTATMDALNKYFSISNMPIVSSQYWNDLFGRAPGEAAQDAEGLQTMRVLARNMAFLMKAIALGRETYGLPQKEDRVFTHFIRGEG